MTTNGDLDKGFTVKEVVLDIRDTVNKLADKIDRIDRTGSIGTRQQLDDHENRIRKNEARLLVLEDTKIKREEMHTLRNDIAAIRLGLANRPEQIAEFKDLQVAVEKLEGWRWRMVGAYTGICLLVPAVAAIAWHIWN